MIVPLSNKLIEWSSIFLNKVYEWSVIFFNKVYQWGIYFIDLLPWIIEKTIEYFKYIWNSIYSHLLYPLYRTFIYYPFYVFLWQTIMMKIWENIYDLYCVTWDMSIAILTAIDNSFWNMYNGFTQLYEALYNGIGDLYNKLYSQLFTGRFTIIMNDLYEFFFKTYNDIFETLDLFWTRMSERFF